MITSVYVHMQDCLLAVASFSACVAFITGLSQNHISPLTEARDPQAHTISGQAKVSVLVSARVLDAANHSGSLVAPSQSQVNWAGNESARHCHLQSQYSQVSILQLEMHTLDC